jgi:hypothetical protein
MDAAGAPESKIRNEELYRMAAFRIRETANHIATLANSVRDEALRAGLPRMRRAQRRTPADAQPLVTTRALPGW